MALDANEMLAMIEQLWAQDRALKDGWTEDQRQATRFTPAGFVLQYGRTFSHVVRAGEDGCPDLGLGRCYQNSFNMVHKDPARFVYCEGFGLPGHNSPVLPHAWVYDSERMMALDTTWTDGIVIAGVPFRIDYCTEMWFRYAQRNAFGGLIDCWELGIPLLTGCHKPEHFLETDFTLPASDGMMQPSLSLESP